MHLEAQILVHLFGFNFTFLYLLWLLETAFLAFVPTDDFM